MPQPKERKKKLQTANFSMRKIHTIENWPDSIYVCDGSSILRQMILCGRKLESIRPTKSNSIGWSAASVSGE